MNHHVQHYFSVEAESGHFHSVIPLHDELGMSWETAVDLAPSLPRGWFELSQLPKVDRLEFVRGFWFATLPYIPHVQEGLERFFSRVDDIGIYLTQKGMGDDLVPEIIYSQVNESSFFHGQVPATSNELAHLHAQFVEHPLPIDYYAFLKIHNRFSKVTDTGLISASMLSVTTEDFHSMLAHRGPLMRPGSTTEEINRATLIPFYQSFGMDCFQCFYADWYPAEEMGNLYYSGIDHTLSNHKAKGTPAQKLAFPTFGEWLIFYLETL